MLPLGAAGVAVAGYELPYDTRSVAEERMRIVEPCFRGIQRAGDVLALPAATLLHAGPPVGTRISPVLRDAVLAACVREALAPDADTARRLLAAGRIALHPAQDFGVVTSVDQVVGPGSRLACVRDRNDPQREAFTPLNEESPYELGVDVPFNGVLIERDRRAPAARLAAAARKCILRAGEGVPGCTIVTALGANGSAVGMQISALGRQWLTTDTLWLRLIHPRLRRPDEGILAAGDDLVRLALGAGGGAREALDARDQVASDASAQLRQIPAGLFTMGLARVRPANWSVMIPPH